MTNSRRMLVLRAVIEDYIRSQEPVGSGTLTKDHDLGVSSATVRNDMATLEDEGFLIQPHTSAGRIPTEKGYRYFVDKLANVVPLSLAQRRGIESFLSGSVNLEDTLQRSARLLAQITGQVAVVASPSLAKSTLRRLEIIPLGPLALMIVVITDTGRVAQRSIRCGTPIKQEMVEDLSRVINARNQGVNLSTAGEDIRQLGTSVKFRPINELCDRLAEEMEGMASQEQASSLYMAGTSQLTHQQAVNLSDLAPLFDALEEQVVLMKLMSTLSEVSQTSGVSVAIGSETHNPGLIHASVVASGYGSTASPSDSEGHERVDTERARALGTGASSTEMQEANEPVAFVGSIGPTHMNYATTMAAVHAVAHYLTALLANQGGEDGL
ncbi:heat-inducible transcriptional repressor HrcA [Bifidobacterium crudilactis]|uniref:heat-inducible transcriptional repressor HrcA n=1 Tax=Bifidobacterium crudilactis TaxID=327277 RepID=UPI00235612BA|nr:heat-inducible transcriptional repressor HrcA [Bifidobacterium crudilactis]MCI1217816.1 heat-inducible transcriptional repressor HrcA [Bifidobacterium crudilactis]